ncbi:MAG: DUF4440 domain-containing protein [Thermoanaerobaculia bacterium]|jgi:hypothetical protein
MTSERSPAAADVDAKCAIDRLVASFFGLFSNRGGVVPDLNAIFELFIAEGIVSKCVAVPPEVSTLEAFIAPRRELLSNGRLKEFEEHETAERTLILGNVAQRVSGYTKSGVLNGMPFSTRGVKLFQFVRTDGGWRIASVAWDDERAGFSGESLTQAVRED